MNAGPDTPRVTFRLPRTAYAIVLFILFGTIPLAFTAGPFTFDKKGGAQGAEGVVGWQTLLLVVPVVVAVYVARTATFVDATGIRVRAAFGSRHLPWDEIRGLSVRDRSVYAVCSDGSVRLPCVRVGGLAIVARASGGRLPDIADPKPKPAPQRGRRR